MTETGIRRLALRKNGCVAAKASAKIARISEDKQPGQLQLVFFLSPFFSLNDSFPENQAGNHASLVPVAQVVDPNQYGDCGESGERKWIEEKKAFEFFEGRRPKLRCFLNPIESRTLPTLASRSVPGFYRRSLAKTGNHSWRHFRSISPGDFPMMLCIGIAVGNR